MPQKAFPWTQSLVWLTVRRTPLGGGRVCLSVGGSGFSGDPFSMTCCVSGLSYGPLSTTSFSKATFENPAKQSNKNKYMYKINLKKKTNQNKTKQNQQTNKPNTPKQTDIMFRNFVTSRYAFPSPGHIRALHVSLLLVLYQSTYPGWRPWGCFLGSEAGVLCDHVRTLPLGRPARYVWECPDLTIKTTKS